MPSLTWAGQWRAEGRGDGNCRGRVKGLLESEEDFEGFDGAVFCDGASVFLNGIHLAGVCLMCAGANDVNSVGRGQCSDVWIGLGKVEEIWRSQCRG